MKVSLFISIQSTMCQFESFNQYFANALSEIDHHNKIQGILFSHEVNINWNIQDVKDGLQDCLKTAAGDPYVESLCYEAVFSSDYFWL